MADAEGIDKELRRLRCYREERKEDEAKDSRDDVQCIIIR